MKIDLLNKTDLTLANKNNYRYPLAVVEKDYFLALVLQMIYNSKLKDKLVFKGGTAIHHLYLDQLRFSEDLDFTALDTISISDLEEVIKPFDFLEIVKYYPSKFALKVERLKFVGPLGQANSIKLDVSFDQNLILPATEIDYRNIFKVPITVQAMALEEICAEKLRAINERARYRDFYDLATVLKNNNFEPEKILEILKQKELRAPLSSESILSNLEIAEEARISGAENLYYREHLDIEEVKAAISGFLSIINSE